ncbi:hypothetical protein EON00_07275 [Burkholderia sp. ISTR5]|nr:hypothetical protein [Burkholderia sp. ISTR5]
MSAQVGRPGSQAADHGIARLHVVLGRRDLVGQIVALGTQRSHIHDAGCYGRDEHGAGQQLDQQGAQEVHAASWPAAA